MPVPLVETTPRIIPAHIKTRQDTNNNNLHLVIMCNHRVISLKLRLTFPVFWINLFDQPKYQFISKRTLITLKYMSDMA